jgi:hypothetical protein
MTDAEAKVGPDGGSNIPSGGVELRQAVGQLKR